MFHEIIDLLASVFSDDNFEVEILFESHIFH